MRDIYLISGLGADKRVYDFLNLSDFKLNYIDWIIPEDNETIEHYAKKLTGQIPTKKPIIIGVSFGGIIAIEIGKLIDTEAIIIISSAKTRSDIPLYFRAAGLLGINKIIPTRLFKNPINLTYWFFGVKTSREKELLKNFMSETDKGFLKWAIDRIVNWKNKRILNNLTHIHGTADRLLPLRTADYQIQNGGHFMILNKAFEIEGLIKKTLG